MNSFAHYLVQGLLIILLGYTAQAQKHELQSVIKKYKPYYNSENTKMGILVKKNGDFESATVGFQDDIIRKVFCIGSATKTFTAVLILQEMERGTLKLNDSIGKFLNPIKNIPSNLTVEQLLRHESGIGQTVGGPNVDGYSANNDVLLRQSVYENIEPQDTAKIGVHRYTNTNYILLGEILEKINDAPYDQLLKDRIFKICGMENTYPYVSKNIPHLMHPFTMEGKDIYNKINYKYFKDRVFAAGSIASTLRDMAQFYQDLYETEKLIKKSSFNLMKVFHKGNYGLGLRKRKINDTEFIGHGGNIEGYGFRNFYDPKSGNMFLISWNKVLPAFKNSLREDLAAYLKNEPVKVFRENILTEFQPYLGSYLLKGPELEFSLFKENAIIYLHMQGASFPLVSQEEGVLYDGSSSVHFITQKENPDQLIFKQGDHELIAERVDVK